jgi:hypothetical protein
MSRVRVALLAISIVALFTAQWATPAFGSADAFTGAWTATDVSDGSTLKLQIGTPNASGVRHVTLMDQYASACGALATGIGSGTDSGTTLSTALDLRCGGSTLADDVVVTFDAVGATLVGFGVVWQRLGS